MSFLINVLLKQSCQLVRNACTLINASDVQIEFSFFRTTVTDGKIDAKGYKKQPSVLSRPCFDNYFTQMIMSFGKIYVKGWI